LYERRQRQDRDQLDKGSRNIKREQAGNRTAGDPELMGNLEHAQHNQSR
jgi:hypothetical protein